MKTNAVTVTRTTRMIATINAETEKTAEKVNTEKTREAKAKIVICTERTVDTLGLNFVTTSTISTLQSIPTTNAMMVDAAKVETNADKTTIVTMMTIVMTMSTKTTAMATTMTTPDNNPIIKTHNRVMITVVSLSH